MERVSAIDKSKKDSVETQESIPAAQRERGAAHCRRRLSVYIQGACHQDLDDPRVHWTLPSAMVPSVELNGLLPPHISFMEGQ
jgi:hypothetical protein